MSHEKEMILTDLKNMKKKNSSGYNFCIFTCVYSHIYNNINVIYSKKFMKQNGRQDVGEFSAF